MYLASFTLRCFYCLAFFVLLYSNAQAQLPLKCFDEKTLDTTLYSDLGYNKKIPAEIRAQALIALAYYPELKDVKIIFRCRKRISPLSTRPKLLNSFKNRKNRTYVITISNKTIKKLSPILFYKLPFNAQIGVLGHELGHVADFNNMKTLQLIKSFFLMFNSKYIDRFEYNTDLICINHGLGFQLYDWSKYVRDSLQISEWKGGSINSAYKNDTLQKQRYMNPKTIEKYISSNVIYQRIK